MVPAGDSQYYRAPIDEADRHASDLGYIRPLRTAGSGEDYRREVFRALGRELYARINVVFAWCFIYRLRRLRADRAWAFAFGAVGCFASWHPLGHA